MNVVVRACCCRFPMISGRRFSRVSVARHADALPVICFIILHEAFCACGALPPSKDGTANTPSDDMSIKSACALDGKARCSGADNAGGTRSFNTIAAAGCWDTFWSEQRHRLGQARNGQ